MFGFLCEISTVAQIQQNFGSGEEKWVKSDWN